MHDTQSQPSTILTLLLRMILLAGGLSLALVVHAPNHLLSALGRLVLQHGWIDALNMTLPTALRSSFWIPAALLALGLGLRNRGASVGSDAPEASRRDIALALGITALACAIRLWPLLREPWIKPDYDEGVYLGGAWLLRDGILPYRDFVFPHLPGALVLLQPAAWLIQRWQDNSAALLAGRVTAALADGLTAGLLFLAARQLVSVPGALLAAAVYASDTLLIEYSRGVRLEPLQAPWLAASALLLLVSLRGEWRRWAFWAGVCAAVGVGVKITGAAFVAAGLIALVAERRWRLGGAAVLGLALGGLVLCGWSLLVSGDEIVRQTVLLQIQRPAEPYRERWEWLLGDQWTAFTAIAALLGSAALVVRAWRRRVASGWLFASLWLALTYALLALSASFYDHYYTALAAPLALLAAAAPELLPARRRLMALAPAALLLGPLWWGQARLWRNVDRAPTDRPLVAALLALPPDQPTLTFVPLLHVLSGRPIMQVPDGPYLLDWFLGDPYLDSPLDRRWPDAATARAAAGAAAEYILGSRIDTAPIPTLLQSFIWRPVGKEDGPLLFTRVDRPADVLDAGAGLQLLRRDPGRVEPAEGQTALVQPLHWRAAETPAADQALALAVLDAAGTEVAKVDVPINGGTAWTPGEITTLEYRVPLPAELPVGSYRVTATLYSWTDGQRRALTPQVGGVAVDTVELPPVTLQQP